MALGIGTFASDFASKVSAIADTYELAAAYDLVRRKRDLGLRPRVTAASADGEASASST